MKRPTDGLGLTLACDQGAWRAGHGRQRMRASAMRNHGTSDGDPRLNGPVHCPLWL